MASKRFQPTDGVGAARNVQLNIRVPESENELVRTCAEKHGLKPSSLVRQMIQHCLRELEQE